MRLARKNWPQSYKESAIWTLFHFNTIAKKKGNPKDRQKFECVYLIYLYFAPLNTTLAFRDMDFRKDIGAGLYNFITRRVVYHSFFWLFSLIVLILIEGFEQGFWFTLSNEIIRIFFYCLIVYFNLYYLIPNYLTQNKFLTYCGLLILATVIITPLNVIVFYLKFTGHPVAQQMLVESRNFYFLVSFLVAGISTIVKIVSDWSKQLKEKQELETQTMQSELRFLKSQINPHFLFNTLNNLYALTLKKSDQAPEIVLKLSEMMRYMLYECNEKRVPLSKEVNYIQNYLDLERLRHGKKVDIQFEVEGQVGEQKIAPLMFIPFLENSFKHGLNNLITKGFVLIRMQVESNTVYFFIENSKPDVLPPRDLRRSGGIGLVNVHRRLNLLYPENYALDIDDNPNSYVVNLKINLN